MEDSEGRAGSVPPVRHDPAAANGHSSKAAARGDFDRAVPAGKGPPASNRGVPRPAAGTGRPEEVSRCALGHHWVLSKFR